MAVMQSYRRVLAVLALFGLVMLGNLGGWELKGADEPRYAQIAREMRETGRYIVPHLNGEAYPDKPPVLFWLMALAAAPQGDVTAFAARLPSALAGLGLIFVTFLLASRLFDPATGLLAAGVLFCCEQFFSTATSAHLDTLLTFWTTLSILLFYAGYTAGENGKTYVLGAYAAMGAAVLTKGPVGLLVPLGTMLSYVLAQKEFRRLRDLQIGRGLCIAVGISAAWLLPACLMGGEAYTNNILFRQTFDRAVDSFAHKEPLFFYLFNFPDDFLPWSLFIPAAAVYFWNTRRAQHKLLLPLVWFAFTFVFFSLVSGKRNLYLLPLYPAAAILMAKFIADFVRRDEVFARFSRSKLIVVPCFFIAAALAAAGAAGLVMLIGNIGPAQHVEAGRWVLLAAACAALGAGALWWRRLYSAAWLRRLPHMVIGCTACIYGLWAGAVMPAAVDMQPEYSFCRTVAKTVGPDDRLYATFSPEFFNYFLNRYPIPVVRDLQAVERLLASPEKVYFLAREKDYRFVPDSYKKRVTVLAKEDGGHKTVYLLVNKPSVGS